MGFKLFILLLLSFTLNTVAQAHSCPQSFKEFKQSIQKELGFYEMNDTFWSFNNALNEAERHRLKMYLAQSSSDTDPVWGRLDDRRDHNAPHEVTGSVLTRLSGVLNGHKYEINPDSPGLPSVLRHTPEYRETIYFDYPKFAIGRRIFNPKSIHSQRYSEIDDVVVSGVIDMRTRKGESFIAFSKTDASGHTTQYSKTINEFAQELWDKECLPKPSSSAFTSSQTTAVE